MVYKSIEHAGVTEEFCRLIFFRTFSMIIELPVNVGQCALINSTFIEIRKHLVIGHFIGHHQSANLK